jgi:hypothetical protein
VRNARLSRLYRMPNLLVTLGWTWIGMLWSRSHRKKKRTLLISPRKHRIKVGTRGLLGDKCCKAM